MSPHLTRRTVLAATAALALPTARGSDIATTGLRPLPALQLADLEGRQAAVPARGKASIVNFWATWCPPCRAEMPLLAALPELYGEQLALQLVNFKERAATVQRYLQASNSALPVLLDPLGDAAAQWGVRVFPTTFGFDTQGRLRWRVRGELDWSGAEAGRLVEALLR